MHSSKTISLILTITFLVCVGHINAQVQVGKTLASQFRYCGTHLIDKSNEAGASVAISFDGTKIVYGSPYECAGYHSNDQKNSLWGGRARVWSENKGDWKQKGLLIQGGNSLELLGSAVSISDKGSKTGSGARLIVGRSGYQVGQFGFGRFDVYELWYSHFYRDSIWRSISPHLTGEAFGDSLGTSVAISRDGSIAAAGAPGNDKNGEGAGFVQVIHYDDSIGGFVVLGERIYGQSAGDHIGRSIAVSGKNKRVAIGAPQNDSLPGYVKIYEFRNGNWSQLGKTIEGAVSGDRAGSSISFSEDGNRIAIGAPGNDDYILDGGQVRVFDWGNGDWVQVGPNIDGAESEGKSGWAVSLSPDGNSLAIGAPFSRNTGQVQVFKWEQSTWSESNARLFGLREGEQFGYSVSLSENGERLAVGSPFDYSGKVRVFDLTTTNFPTKINPPDLPTAAVSIFPNPSTGYLTISSPLARIENVNVYDLQGRTLDMEITWSPRKVHVTTAYRGLTIIKIQTENGLQVKKMVFE